MANNQDQTSDTQLQTPFTAGSTLSGKRKRADTEGEAAKQADLTAAGQVGKRVRFKKGPVPKTCDICEEEKDTEKDFPRSCTHDTNTCATCLASTLTACLSSTHISKIGCAQCPLPWKVSQLTLFASDENIHKYTTLYGEVDPNFHRYFGPACQHRKVYERTLKRPRFKCKKCAFEMCFRHKTPWHKGRSCKQYDNQAADQVSQAARTQVQQRLEREEKSTEAKVKKCPKCGVAIYKTAGGCDHMQCT